MRLAVSVIWNTIPLCPFHLQMVGDAQLCRAEKTMPPQTYRVDKQRIARDLLFQQSLESGLESTRGRRMTLRCCRPSKSEPTKLLQGHVMRELLSLLFTHQELAHGNCLPALCYVWWVFNFQWPSSISCFWHTAMHTALVQSQAWRGMGRAIRNFWGLFTMWEDIFTCLCPYRVM